jgi:transcriptional regulator with XRE-family HTH domain
MLTAHQVELLSKLSYFLKDTKIGQKEVEAATGVHQSQISRIISGNVRRASPNVLRLCKYADSLAPLPKVDVDSGNDLICAFQELLGKSAEEDVALRQIVASLRAWRQACANTR